MSVDADALAQYLGQWLDVSPAQSATLLPFVRRVAYDRGDWLFRAGDPVDDLVLLEAGLLRGCYLSGDREVNLRLLSAPAAALPFNSYLAGTPADEALQALAPVRGWRVRFRAFCKAHPDLLAERMQRILAERHCVALQRRLHMLQCKSASERYAYYLAHMEPEIIAGTPAYHVASYLSITPESLSRVRTSAGRPPHLDNC